MSKIKFSVQSFDKETGRAVWILEGPRLSFPHMFSPGMYEGKPSTRLSAGFLIPKEEKAIAKAIMQQMMLVARSQMPKIKKLTQLKNVKFKSNEDEEGEVDGWILLSTNDLKHPPVYFNHKGKKERDPIGAGAEETLYGGCHVKAKFQVNGDSDNKKVWVNLAAIQFLEDGERFGGAGLSDDELDEGFDEVEGDFDKPDNGADDFDDDEDFELD